MSQGSKAKRLALKRRLTQPEREVIGRARRARRRLGMHHFLPLRAIRAHLPDMEARRVSTVCRGPGGFLEAYVDADGDPARLPPWWHARRAAFIARMHAQLVRRCEPLYDERGRPTRRHLALIAWAWSPEAALATAPTSVRRAE